MSIVQAAALAIVLLVGTVAVQTVRLGAAQNAAESAAIDLKSCRHDLDVETQNRETCDAKIAEQNAAVNAAAASCTRDSESAGERAREVLRRPTITVRDGTGPEVMNQWLDALLSSSR